MDTFKITYLRISDNKQGTAEVEAESPKRALEDGSVRMAKRSGWKDEPFRLVSIEKLTRKKS